MNVLIVTNMYPSEYHKYRGIFIKEHVDSLRKVGVSIDVFFTNSKRTRSAYFLDLPNLVKCIKSKQYDVFHAVHSYCALQLMFARAWSGYQTPILLTSHEGESLLTRNIRDTNGDVLSRIVYINRIKRFAAEKVDEVIFVEKHIPDAIGYSGKYHILPPGVDFNLFKPISKSICRDRLNFSHEDVILFFPADPNNPNKGYGLIQDSLRLLPKNYHLIAGGSIYHSDMPYYINAADLVIQASAYEASPMVVKETMACNRTMISTDVGDVKEVFGDTQGYFLSNRKPDDIAGKIQLGIEFGSDTQGRIRLEDIGLSLEQVSLRHKQIYEMAFKY